MYSFKKIPLGAIYLTCNPGHSTWVTLLWYLPFSLPMLWCNGFSVELSNFKGEGKGRRPTQVLMSRIVACFLQGNVRMVCCYFSRENNRFLEILVVNFQKCWFLETGNPNLETRFSRPEIRVRSSFQSWLSRLKSRLSIFFWAVL